MSKIVFVLGAGASAHSGTPLMGNFLEVAQDLLRRGGVEEVKEDFIKVLDAVGKLHAAQSKSVINTYNIEDVYAAFEMGKLLGRLPGIEEDKELEGLTYSIKKVISYTLERTTKLPKEGRGQFVAPQEYRDFTNIIDKIIKEKRDCSIITFNYDLGLDYALQRRSIFPDYGLGDMNSTGERSVGLIKLHGSLNWVKCEDCKKIVIQRELRHLDIEADYSIIPITSQLKRLKCPTCKKLLGEDPFIVPPTWNKTTYHEQIEPVWKKAATELKDSEQIFVVGYSLPITDMFFRYLFALGVDMRTILRGFYVYDIDSDVEERFKNLLSSGIEKRFHFYQHSFENAIQFKHDIMLDVGGPGLETIPEILNIRDTGSTVMTVKSPYKF